MARYEGMDELLQGLRARLEAGQARAREARVEGRMAFNMPVQAETYDGVTVRLGVLLREAERLRGMVTADALDGLSDDQRDHLLQLLGQVMEELWTCEAALQGVVG